MTFLIIAIVTLALAILAHIVTTVWWASKITWIVERLQTDVQSLLTENKSLPTTYVKKEDYLRDVTRIESKVEAAWTAIDELNKES